MKIKHASRWIHFLSHQPLKGIQNTFFLAVLVLLCSASRVSAQSEATQYASEKASSAHRGRSYLFGDWDGKRSELASRGITFDFFYVADLSDPVGYSSNRGRMGANTRNDGSRPGKLTEWNGLTFHATGLWQFGNNLGADIGALANPVAG